MKKYSLEEGIFCFVWGLGLKREEGVKESNFHCSHSITHPAHLKRIQEMQEFIASQPSTITEFDEKLVSHLLAKVTVSDTTMTFEFKSGVCVEIEN